MRCKVYKVATNGGINGGINGNNKKFKAQYPLSSFESSICLFECGTDSRAASRIN